MKSLLHFLLLGGLLFAAERLTATWPMRAGEQTIHVRSEQVSALETEWRRALGRAPDAAQLQAGVRKLADQEMLVQEALRLGLNRSDAVVRGRLLNNLRFAYPDSTQDDEALLRQALALGMDQRDLVVRRRLVQLMEQRLAAGAEIGDEALRRAIDEHPERYASERRIAFRQVFVSADVHREDLAGAARQLQGRLHTAADTNLGDPFLGGSSFGLWSEADIAKLFGAAFAHAAIAAPANRWIGPLASVYGLHFVHVDTVQPAQDADLESLRQRLSYAVLEQQENSRVEQALVSLRRRYPLVVDAPPAQGALR